MTRDEYLKFLNDPKPAPLVERWREAGKRVGGDWVIPNRPYRVVRKAGPDVEIGELLICTEPNKRSGIPGDWRWFKTIAPLGTPLSAVWLGPEDVELVMPVQLDDANDSTLKP